jgi:hypothetical protein
MKVPDTLFFSHCPNISPERKEFLLQHIKERVDIKDVRFFEDYNHDHPFVEWLHHVKKPPYGTKLTSNLVKGLYRFKTMVDENITSAILADDDVVFHKDWREILESVDIPQEVIFLNLGTPPYEGSKPPKKGVGYILGNNGGCEASYATLDFAKLFLKHFTFLHGGDIIIHGLLSIIGHQLICIPVCNQTSGLMRCSSLEHETKAESLVKWQDVVKNYGKIVHENFYVILEEYDIYCDLKKKKEDKFNELFGKKINIRDVGYILNSQNDILEYD